MSEDDYDVDRRVRRHAESVRAVMRGVGPQVRGMAQEEAEQHLLSAFRQRQIYVPMDEVRLLAMMERDRWWSARHPRRARAQFRKWKEETATKEAEIEREVDRVAEQVESVLDTAHAVTSWTLYNTRTYEGMEHEVVLRPYSEPLAKRIRDAVHPVRISVRGESSSP